MQYDTQYTLIFTPLSCFALHWLKIYCHYTNL